MAASRRLRSLLRVAHPTPFLKQLPTTLGTAIAVVVILIVPSVAATQVSAAIAGVGIVLLATILARVITDVKRLERLAIIVPVIDFLALGAFRAGTGGSTSLFSALIILPVVWVAAEKGRGFIVLAAAGSSVALLMQFILGTDSPADTSAVVRAVFTPLVFAFAAAVVNELARQSRLQFATLRELANQKEQALTSISDYARRLEEGEVKFRAADRMFRGVWAAVTEQSVIGTDVTGLIDAWNVGAQKLLGLSAEETENKRYVFEFHVQEELDDRARELHYPHGATVLNPGFSALVEMARIGDAESREWLYRRDDGSLVPVALSVTKRTDDAGEIVGYLFVAVDVTQAREVSRLKDEFVGLISHELRTPLSSILGYLELMKDDEEHPLSDEQMRYLGVAERNAHRLLRLVGDLLFTAQVESGKFPLEIREVELSHILSASVESARPMADAAGIELIEQTHSDGLVLHGDPVRLGQSFDNLISNALKFTPRGGTVTVGLVREAGEAVVTVRDTGMGIAASELDQLFGRFFRASTATQNAVPGVGLGLTITKAIVLAHRGEMEVESEEGVGTCFSMKLPVDAPPIA
ncbi:MAG: ATP-binding protein [Actinomycetota bacterium]|nr:ATP-binding protein [Actinomycetota bacterium]